MTLDFDPCLPHSDPYPLYRVLREEAPVHRSESTGVLCVSRYKDVLAILRDSETFSSRAMQTFLMEGGMASKPTLNWQVVRMLFGTIFRARMNPFTLQSGRNLIGEDGETHLEMRNIVNRGFTPRQIARWKSRAKEIVAESMQALDTSNEFEVVQQLSIPLPVTIIAELLGIEKERHQDFKRWSNKIIDLATGPRRGNPFQAETVDAFLELSEYLGQVTRARKKNPGDDLVSTIVSSRPDETALSTQETVNFVTLLLVAGNETTTNLIGNAVNALLDHPNQMQIAAKEPSRIPDVIEEALRYDAPIQLLFREAVRDTQIAGTPIPKGTVVSPLLASANRDERRFEDPDQFDIMRKPQGHMGFGFGAHFCLGTSLARLEAGAALEALLPRLPYLERIEPVQHIDSFLIRGPVRLRLQHAA